MDALLVVIADPNEATRDLLDDVYRSEFGAYVTRLGSVSELETAMTESVPALVVIEIGRDRLAEVEIVADLKRRHPRVPFLVLTAWGLRIENIEGKTGADVVIAKPFELEDVIVSSSRLLGTTPLVEVRDQPA
jgi:DNA-binding response OmpR family regulator